ncbi:hypothetical protein Ciccas_006952 [Cichlidogyrus casuarinus]|uniref:Uncharacterized protein n=1 Tax=Cichlidogyrus casuarinus TaxID=1844966 RepID=A0ABD2Q4U2_9PLAT
MVNKKDQCTIEELKKSGFARKVSSLGFDGDLSLNEFSFETSLAAKNVRLDLNGQWVQVVIEDLEISGDEITTPPYYIPSDRSYKPEHIPEEEKCSVPVRVDLDFDQLPISCDLKEVARKGFSYKMESLFPGRNEYVLKVGAGYKGAAEKLGNSIQKIHLRLGNLVEINPRKAPVIVLMKYLDIETVTVTKATFNADDKTITIKLSATKPDHGELFIRVLGPTLKGAKYDQRGIIFRYRTKQYESEEQTYTFDCSDLSDEMIDQIGFVNKLKKMGKQSELEAIFDPNLDYIVLALQCGEFFRRLIINIQIAMPDEDTTNCGVPQYVNLEF